MTTENKYTRRWKISAPVCRVCGTHCDHDKLGRSLDYVRCMRDTIGLVKTGKSCYETKHGAWEVIKRPGRQSWYYRGIGSDRVGSYSTLAEAVHWLYVNELAPEGSHYANIRNQS